MKLFAFLLLLPTLGFSQDLSYPCTKGFAVESRFVHALGTTEFLGASNSSGAFKANGKWKCFQNMDTTAANVIYISSYAMTSATIDTAKAIPVHGGSVQDARVCFPWGPNVKTFLFKIATRGLAQAWMCE